MRYSRWMIALLMVCWWMAAAVAMADDVTYVSKEQVAAAMAKGGPLTDGSNYKVSISRRTGPGQAEVHDGETDVFYIMEGSATFVTGGTLTDKKTASAGQSRGSGIQGGKSQTLNKGDVMVIPKGVPHWFKEVPELVVYYVVKVL
jgi:mannose-6-phosphate isomerase-like protein (cupin superfamily)